MISKKRTDLKEIEKLPYTTLDDYEYYHHFCNSSEEEYVMEEEDDEILRTPLEGREVNFHRPIPPAQRVRPKRSNVFMIDFPQSLKECIGNRKGRVVVIADNRCGERRPIIHPSSELCVVMIQAETFDSVPIHLRFPQKQHTKYNSKFIVNDDMELHVPFIATWPSQGMNSGTLKARLYTRYNRLSSDYLFRCAFVTDIQLKKSIPKGYVIQMYYDIHAIWNK